MADQLAEKALRMGFTTNEVIESDTIDKLLELTNSVKKRKDEPPCCDASDKRRNCQGVLACVNCGEIVDTHCGYVLEFIPNIWLYQRSRHSRVRWFKRMISNFVEMRHVDVLTHDFSMVAIKMVDHDLLKGLNMSRYGYYVVRLASRRKIALTRQVRDVKNKRTRRVFDDRLFGTIYPLLGWDKDCDCPYYAAYICSEGRILDKIFERYRKGVANIHARFSALVFALAAEDNLKALKKTPSDSVIVRDVIPYCRDLDAAKKRVKHGESCIVADKMFVRYAVDYVKARLCCCDHLPCECGCGGEIRYCWCVPQLDYDD